MQPKEGNAGSLYEYVQTRRHEISEAKRLAEQVERRQAELDAEQRRVTYEKLPERFRNLFARFSAIELLEEVKDKFWTKDMLLDRFWKDSKDKDSKDSVVSVVSIGGNPGIKLESYSVTVETYGVYDTYMASGDTTSIRGNSGGHMVRVRTGSESVPYKSVNLMYVIAEEPKPPRNYYHVGREEELLSVIDKGSEPTGSESDFDLRFLLFRDGHYHYNDPVVPDGSAPPCIDRRIKATEPPDTLKKVIGDYLMGRGGNKY